MKILYTSAEVRQAIKSLFSTSKGRRVAITAFVGDSAGAYLPKPEGIELICWPKAGGTNPNAVRDLIARKVDVRFADSVHMKIYWAEGKGAVITSANLSTYALGSGGLKEVGVLLPAGKVNIGKIITSLDSRPVSNAELLKLDDAHSNFVKASRMIKNEKMAEHRAKSFSKWYSLTARPRWKFGWYWSMRVPLSARAKSVLEKEHGSSDCHDIMTATEGFFQENDWILCFNVDGKNARWASWMFAHHIVKVPPSDKKAYDAYAPNQVLQVYKLKAYDQPPFRLDRKLKYALRNAINDYGGISTITEMDTAKPPKKLIDLIYEHYK